MIDFLKRLKDKGCSVIYTEEGFKDYYEKPESQFYKIIKRRKEFIR